MPKIFLFVFRLPKPQTILCFWLLIRVHMYILSNTEQGVLGIYTYNTTYNMWYGLVLYIWIGLMFHISATFICFTLYCSALLVAVENE